MKRRALDRVTQLTLRGAGALLLAGGILFATAAPVTSAQEFIINMKSFAFIPANQFVQSPELAIDQGDTVTWVYAETAADGGCEVVPNCPGHSTTSSTAPWDSKIFGKAVPPSDVSYPNKRYSVRFDKAGTFDYICKVHSNQAAPANLGNGMKSKITVRASTSGAGGGGGGGNVTPVTKPLAASGVPTGLMSAAGLAALWASWRIGRSLRRKPAR